MGQEFATGALRPQAYASLVPRDLVLADLGCGAGFLTEYLVQRGARVIAVDHSQAMLDAAQRRVGGGDARGGGGGAEFRQGEMDRLPLADGEVDAGFSNLVWHHLPSLERAAHELRRVVRPGGHAVVTDLLPHAEEWMRLEMGDLRLGLEPDAVGNALAQAGFAHVEIEALHDRYVVAGRVGRKAALPMFLVRAQAPATTGAARSSNGSVRVGQPLAETPALAKTRDNQPTE